MKTVVQTSFQHCSDMVRRGDEDRWLSTHYAPATARRRLCALYALHLEIERIPAIVGEPPLGEIRLQWWREALDEIRAKKKPHAHLVVEAVAASDIVSEYAHARLIAAIEARARLLYGEGFAEIDDLVAWLRCAESHLSAIAACILGSPPVKDQMAIENAAIAYAIARHGRAFAPNLHSQFQECALSLLAEGAPVLNTLSHEIMPAIAHFTLTRRYLKDAHPPSALGKRIRILRTVASGRI